MFQPEYWYEIKVQYELEEYCINVTVIRMRYETVIYI